MIRMLMILLVVAATLTGCKNEQREKAARDLHAVYQRYLENEQYDRAGEVLRTLQVNYSETELAKQAEDQIVRVESLKQIWIDSKHSEQTSSFTRIALALDNYKLRNQSYPKTFEELRNSDMPETMKASLEDVWGNPVYYKAYTEGDSDTLDQYVIASFGQEGLPGGSGTNSDRFFKNGSEVESLQL